MIVRNEQENASPPSQSHSDPCMVLRGGAIPASLQTFPGMEHDRGLFKELSQDGPLNGISDVIAETNSFDDEQELEAAAAASEAQLKSSFISASTVVASSPVPPVVIPEAPSNMAPPNQTLSPLHINVTECSKMESEAPSSSSDIPSNGFDSRKKPFQQPRNIRDYPTQRPSTSSATAPIIMGPPTNAPVLLSPAGNFHNGYQRMSSGDSAPSSPSLLIRPMSKNSQIPHPLAMQRSAHAQPPHRGSVSSQPSHSSRPSSSTTSPQHGRKEHEMTRRRALVDRIAKSRGADYVHLLPQVEALTHTQTSIMLRKHRGSLQANGMPYSLQQLIDCTAEPDITTETFIKKIKEVNLMKRGRNDDIDEATDVSDLEGELERSDSQERTTEKEVPRWTTKRMRYGGMLSRVDSLLAEKVALMKKLQSESLVLDASCGVRFVGDEMITRRRRRLNGTYYLYDKNPLRKASSEQFGCARAMPIQSWTKRKPIRNVFEDTAEETSTGSVVLKTNQSPNEKWVTIGQHTTVSFMTNGERREVAETDYEEYRVGEGLQQVPELSAMDPMEFVATSEFTPFEERLMTYMCRLSTAPSSTIRKKHGRAIYFETDDRRSPSERNPAVKVVPVRIKSDKKKERKRVEEESSDEEAPTPVRKKKPRGRPAASVKKKSSRPSTSSNRHHNGIYLDYLFDDYMTDESCVKTLPDTAAFKFKEIHVPEWSTLPDNYWDDGPDVSKSSSADNKPADDLLLVVAKQHHRLMHMERERIQKESEKRIRNRQSALKSAAATPARNADDEDDEDGRFPPFDMRQFKPTLIPSRRRFVSVEKPFEPRVFTRNKPSESSS